MSAEQVVINFTGDTSGLQPVENVLEKIIAQSGETGQAWLKASQKIDAANKTNTESGNKVVKSIADLNTASKSMDKVVIGAAYRQALVQIQAQLGLTQKELVNYVKNARKAAQEKIITGATDEEIQQLTLSLEVMNDQLKEFGVSEDGVTDKSQSLKAQLKQMKEELAGMEVAGQRGTEAYEALKNKAGQLSDAIGDANDAIKRSGSDTRGLSNVIDLASGAAAGFNVVSGAAGLLAGENEEVQQALLRVGQAQQLLIGLQEIQELLSKEQFASLGALLGLKTKDVAVTGAQAAATTAEAAATAEATVATGAWNAVLAINPIFLLLAAIVATVAAITLFSSATEDNTDAQIKHNEALLEEIKTRKELDDLFKTDIGTQGRLQNVDLAYLQEKNKRQDLILKKEYEIAQARQLTAQENYRLNQADIDQMRAWEQRLEEIRLKVAALKDANEDGSGRQIDLLDSEERKLKVLYDKAKGFSEEYYNANRDAQLKQIDLENYRIEIAKRNADALFEIEKRRLERQSELYKKTVDKAPDEFYNLRVEAQKAYTAKEIELQNKLMAHELKTENLTDGEKLNIENKYSVEISKLREQNNDRLAELLLDRNVLIKKANEQAKDDEKRMYEEILKTQQQAFVPDPNAHTDRITGELAFIQEGYDQMAVLRNTDYLKRKAELDQHRVEGQLGEGQYQKDLLKLNDTYNAEVINLQINSIDRQLQEVDRGSKEEAKLLNDRAKLKEQLDIQDIEKTRRNEALRIQIIQAANQVINEAAQALFSTQNEARQRNLDNALQALEVQKNEELNNKNLTEGQKQEIDKRYRDRERQEKIKAFNADKEAKKEQAIINGLLAVSLAFATTPFPGSLITAAIVAASTAIQVAKISSTPTPKFRHGEIDIKGPGTTTSDSINAQISKGESVINANATSKWKQALIAINNNTFDSYLKNKFTDFVYPQVPEGLVVQSTQPSIDYDKLGEVLVSKLKGAIPAANHLHTNIDSNGFRTYIKTALGETEIKNERYSML